MMTVRMSMVLLRSIVFFAEATIVCGILYMLSVLPAWPFWVCLGIFWIIGVAEAIVEAIGSIRLYRRWLRGAQRCQKAKCIEDCKAWIRKEVIDLCWYPLVLSITIFFYVVVGMAIELLKSIKNWKAKRKIQVT